MSFDVSLVSAGLDVSQVLSDDKHFGSFVCGVCSKLVSLDSVVTNGCDHPFCRKCLEATAMQAFVSQSNCLCPTCNVDLEHTDSRTQCLQVGSLKVSAQPLAQAQPLAYKVLGLVHVACLDGPCEWSGNYSDYLKHAMSHHGDTATKRDVSSEKTVSADSSSTKHERKRSDSIHISPVGAITDEGREEKAHQSDTIDRSSSRRKEGSLSNKQYNDWNMSIASNMGLWDEDEYNDSELSPMNSPKVSSHHGKSYPGFIADQGPEDDASSSHGEEVDAKIDHRKSLVTKAEKYKKQANAKFNKNEFNAARHLYSRGIKIMGGIELETDEERQLLAIMYSNRAVSFFRNKQFDDCIHDSDMAIKHQPDLEKSWIRKWRALKAKGEFDEAYIFISKAIKSLPKSQKLQQHYEDCKKEKELLKTVQAYMAKGDVVSARSAVDPSVGSDCDNLVLFVYSARLSITVGALEEALEKINKALRFNPHYVDALESRGFLYFFQGEMEKASTFLYDAHVRYKENTNVKAALDRVRKTKSYYEQANDMVEQKKYKESVEAFSAAIHSSSPMPPLAPLYAILRTHRAESYVSLKQYLPALQDCQEVLKFQTKYSPAWVIRAKVMCALGKAENARKELVSARRSWGAGDPNIEKGFKYVEFELRVSKEDQNMESFKNELDAGDRSRIMQRCESVRRLSIGPSSHHQEKNPREQAPVRRSSRNNTLVPHTSERTMTKGKRQSFSGPLSMSMGNISDFSVEDEPRSRRKSRRSSASGEKDCGERRRRKSHAETKHQSVDGRKQSSAGEEKSGRRERRRSAVDQNAVRPIIELP